MKTVGRPDTSGTATPCTLSVRICVEDRGEFVHTVGRADNGSDESIMSPRPADLAVLNGIEKLTKIEKTKLLVAFKEDDKALFSRAWTPLRIVSIWSLVRYR